MSGGVELRENRADILQEAPVNNGATVALAEPSITQEIVLTFSDGSQLSRQETNRPPGIKKPIYYFCCKYGLNPVAIARRIEGLQFVEKGRNGRYGKSKLYDEEEVAAKIEPFLARPRVDTDTGKYVDSGSVSWLAARTFEGEPYNIPRGVLAPRLEGVLTIAGRGRNNNETVLYPEHIVLEKTRPFLQLPRVDNNGRYTDPEGNSWVNRANLMGKYSIADDDALTTRLDGAPIIAGRGRNNTQITLYLESEAALRLSDFGSRPKVDRSTGGFLDAEMRNLVTINYAAKKYKGIGHKTFVMLLKYTQSFPGRNASGLGVALYDETEIDIVATEYLGHPRIDRAGFYARKDRARPLGELVTLPPAQVSQTGEAIVANVPAQTTDVARSADVPSVTIKVASETSQDLQGGTVFQKAAPISPGQKRGWVLPSEHEAQTKRESPLSGKQKQALLSMQADHLLRGRGHPRIPNLLMPLLHKWDDVEIQEFITELSTLSEDEKVDYESIIDYPSALAAEFVVMRNLRRPAEHFPLAMRDRTVKQFIPYLLRLQKIIREQQAANKREKVTLKDVYKDL